VRTAVLSIQVNLDRLPVDKDLFTSDYGNFIPDLWELALQKELNRKNGRDYTLWFGLITIDNLQALRSKYRLEELNRIQRTLVNSLNPNRFGANGFIGFNSDYVMTYLVNCLSQQKYDDWIQAVEDKFRTPLELSDGKQIKLGIKLGSVRVDSNFNKVHDIVSAAKKELSGELNATG
jgi:hypothetical protein